MRGLFTTILQRIVAPFRRRHLEDDLDAELASHVAMAVEFNLRKGMSTAEAGAKRCEPSAASNRLKKFAGTREDCH